MKDSFFSVFGNETRIHLLLCLSQKPKNVSEMIRTCGLSQSAVSQHLAKLKQENLVRSKKEGKEIIYSLTNKKIITLCRLLLNIQQEVQ